MSNCVPSLILSLVMGVLLATGADALQDPTDTVSIGQDPAHQDDDDLLGGDLLDGDLLSETAMPFLRQRPTSEKETRNHSPRIAPGCIV